MKVSITITLDMADNYFESNPTGNLKAMVHSWIEEVQEESSWDDADFITPGTEPHIAVEEIE